ncbi:MAG: hypothetical protein AB7G93_23585 [Bdellovibrionales bacterium]
MMKKGFVSVLLLGFLSSCASSPTQIENSKRSLASDHFIGVPVIEERLATQGFMECGPAAIFNAFSLGDSEMREKINQLAGATIHEKYSTLIKAIAHRPSEQFRRVRVRTNSEGTWIGDMRFMIQDVLRSSHGIVGKYLLRPDLIYGPEEYPEKIRKEFARSLIKNVPLVILVAGYDGSQRFEGHYMTVTAVSDRMQNGSFVIQFINPDITMPRVSYATISDSLVEYTGRTWEIYDQPEKVVIGRLKTKDGDEISSPFLIFDSPGFTINNRKVEKYVLEQAFGAIPADFY